MVKRHNCSGCHVQSLNVGGFCVEIVCPKFSSLNICAMVKVVAILGMGNLPPLIGILIMGISTPTIGLMTIPYYMEIMGV